MKKAIVLALLFASCGAQAESIPLISEHGTFVVPVVINDKISLNFTIDSGAADVSIPADVFSTLVRAGTIAKTDLLDKQVYVLADGSEQRSQRFRIRSLRVGKVELRSVVASVAPAAGSLLLGQSFLRQLTYWTIDNKQHLLVINEMTSSGGTSSSTAAPAAVPASGDSQEAGEGPSPKETFDFIRKTLLGQGRIIFTRTSHAVNRTGDSTDTVWNSFSFPYEVSPCVVELRRDEKLGSASPWIELNTLHFHSVTKIELMPEPEAENIESHAYIVTSTTPKVIRVTLRGADVRDLGLAKDPYLTFADEALAQRVSKALTHLVQLCGGGGGKEPF